MLFEAEKDLSGKKQTQEALNCTLRGLCEYTKFFPGFVLLPLATARDRVLDLVDFAQQGPFNSFMEVFYKN